MYKKITNGIAVTVLPFYLEEQSAPYESHYVWAYTVLIENKNPYPIKLLDRYWKITDAYGRIHEVRGQGVVGEQPILKHNEAFEYTSGTSLKTPSGIMGGSYDIVVVSEEEAEAPYKPENGIKHKSLEGKSIIDVLESSQNPTTKEEEQEGFISSLAMSIMKPLRKASIPKAGTRFEIEIPAFSLDTPYVKQVLN